MTDEREPDMFGHDDPETPAVDTEFRRSLAKLDAQLGVVEIELEHFPDMHKPGIAELHQLVQDLMERISDFQEQEGWI